MAIYEDDDKSVDDSRAGCLLWVLGGIMGWFGD
jgi:hypothetical protein